MQEQTFEAYADGTSAPPRLKLTRSEAEAQAAVAAAERNAAWTKAESEREAQRFTELAYSGTAFGYAKVWLLNVVAIILSLGILAPWALARSRRYFFTHTTIDGDSFAFAPQSAASCRRVAAIYALIAASVCTIVWQPLTYSAFTAMGFFFLATTLAPSLVRATVKSNFDAISYRSVKVTFVGNGWSAFINYFLLPWVVLLGSFTLYLLSNRGVIVAGGFFMTSIFVYLHQSFKFKNLEFGRRRIRYMGRFKEFRSIYTIPCLVWAGYHASVVLTGYTLFRFGVLTETDLALFTSDNTNNLPAAESPVYIALGVLMLMELLWSWWTEIYIKVRTRSYFFDQLEIDGAKVMDAYTTWSYMRLSASNMLIVIFSLGLLTPWAAVRHQRYLVSRLAIIGHPAALRRLCSSAGPRGEDGFLKN